MYTFVASVKDGPLTPLSLLVHSFSWTAARTNTFFFVDSSTSVEELSAGCEWSRLSRRLCGSRQADRVQDWTRCKIKHRCYKLFASLSTDCCLLTADWWWLCCPCLFRLSWETRPFAMYQCWCWVIKLTVQRPSVKEDWEEPLRLMVKLPER